MIIIYIKFKRFGSHDTTDASSPSVEVDAGHVLHAVVCNKHVPFHPKLEDRGRINGTDSARQERLITGDFNSTRDVDKLHGSRDTCTMCESESAFVC